MTYMPQDQVSLFDLSYQYSINNILYDFSNYDLKSMHNQDDFVERSFLETIADKYHKYYISSMTRITSIDCEISNEWRFFKPTT